MINMIKNFKLNPLTDPKFIFTSLATYEQDNVKKDWEILHAHDSVAILIYHSEFKCFILVKQFRPAVFANNEDGMSIELCAGIVDKDISLQQVAQEEIEEECGYRVELQNVKKITSFYTSVGFAGSKQTLYYAEVDESMKVSEGGGIDNEFIEVIKLDTEDAQEFMYDENIVKTPGLMFAFLWWNEKFKF